MAETIVTVMNIDVGPLGHIRVRQQERVMENEVQISRAFPTYTLCPGDSLAGKDAGVVAVATNIWTTEVMAAYTAKLATMHGPPEVARKRLIPGGWPRG